MANELKTASVLAFERKLDVSDALLFSGKWDNRSDSDWLPVAIREKSVRGTISNRLKTKDQDPAKLHVNTMPALIGSVHKPRSCVSSPMKWDVPCMKYFL